jgi:CRP/FNR family cyclic AMP-dependent transcriptional regulator
MNPRESGPYSIQYKKNDVVCLEHDEEYDLYLIHKGKLLVCGLEGTRVTPIAYLSPGEYFGELSFFDHQARSANAICLEDSTLIKIPVTELEAKCPNWLITLTKSNVKKIRHANHLLAKKGIRRQNVESLKPLSIEEQRHYYQLIDSFKRDRTDHSDNAN